jgi:hypothetical protein
MWHAHFCYNLVSESAVQLALQPTSVRNKVMVLASVIIQFVSKEGVKGVELLRSLKCNVENLPVMVI